MNTKLIIVSTVCLCTFLFSISGCTQYRSTLLEKDISLLQGTSISTRFSSWGKPSQFTYNADGSSQLQWKNIYSDKASLTSLLSDTSLDKLKHDASIICAFSVEVDSFGKVKSHTASCSQDLQNSEVIASLE